MKHLKHILISLFLLGLPLVAILDARPPVAPQPLTTLGMGDVETLGAGWNGDSYASAKDDIHDYIYDQLGDTGYDGLDNDTVTPTRIRLKLDKLTAEPGSLTAGDVYYADEANWDPAGIGIGIAYYVLYDGANWIPLWNEDGDFYVNKSQAAVNVIPDADGIVLTAAQMNSVIVMTGAGDVDIPENMCDSATGKWLIVKSTAAHLNSITSNDATDAFVLSDGTDCGNADELDLGGAAGNQATIVCIQTNKWWVVGEIGTCVDGGGAD